MLIKAFQQIRNRLSSIEEIKTIQIFNNNFEKDGAIMSTPCVYIECEIEELNTLSGFHQQADAKIAIWTVTKSLSGLDGNIDDEKMNEHESINTKIYERLHHWQAKADSNEVKIFNSLQRTNISFLLENDEFLVSQQIFDTTLYQNNVVEQDTVAPGIDILNYEK